MRGVTVHGILLLLTLLLAYPTWTRERTRPTDIQGVVIWDRDTTELRSIAYRSPVREVEITRRTEDGDAFLWAREIVPGSGGDSTTADTLGYPVGVSGEELVRGMAELRVIRDLGMLDSARAGDYGLDDPSASIVLGFADGAREIQVGDSIYGGSDRYGRDVSSGRTFVLPGTLVRPLRIGSGAIRERAVHYFLDADIARVRLEVRGREREMTRTGGSAGQAAVWTEPDDPGQPDLTFANFMERLGQLSIAGFDDEVSERSLDRLLRVDYTGRDGEALGFVELFRNVEGGAYFLRSERTRVPARTVQVFAERVEQDLSQIF